MGSWADQTDNGPGSAWGDDDGDFPSLGAAASTGSKKKAPAGAPPPRGGSDYPDPPSGPRGDGGEDRGGGYDDRGGYDSYERGGDRGGGYDRGGYGDRGGGYGDRGGGYGDRGGGYGDRGGYGGYDRGGYGDRGGGKYDRDGGERGGYKREDRPPRERRPIPSEPPFTAYCGSLSYDATEESIRDFFGEENVKELRLIRFPDSGKPKSCFVELHSAELLQEAVDKDGQDLAGRTLRIDVAEQKQDRGGGKGYGDRGGGKGYGDRGDRSYDRYGSRGGDSGATFDRSMFGSAQPEGPRQDERDRSEGGERGGEKRERKGWGRGGGKGKVDDSEWDSFKAGRQAAAPADGAQSKPRSNPFGDARPIDNSEALRKAEEKAAQLSGSAKGAGRGGNKGKSDKGPREEKPKPEPKSEPAKAPVKAAAQPPPPKAAKTPKSATTGFAALAIEGDDDDEEEEA